jgi:hypothetical protein
MRQAEHRTGVMSLGCHCGMAPVVARELPIRENVVDRHRGPMKRGDNAMIELVPREDDDLAFLELAQRIMNGAVAALDVREVYLVHIDNWFDYKWLGFWSTWKKSELTQLFVPPFNPNRVRSEHHFVWDSKGLEFISAAHKKPLHRRQPGRSPTFAKPLDRVSKSAAFIWYSGNTVTNTAGSLMLNLSGAGAYAWYASFTKDVHWKVDGERRIARRELVTFEERGREMEPARI